MSAARIIFSWRWRGRAMIRRRQCGPAAGRTISGRPAGRPPSRYSEKGSGRPGRRKGSVPGAGPGDGCQVTGRTVFCSRGQDGMQAHLRGLHGGRCGGRGQRCPTGEAVPQRRTAAPHVRPHPVCGKRTRGQTPDAAAGAGRAGSAEGGCVRGFCGRPRRSVAFALPPP